MRPFDLEADLAAEVERLSSVQEPDVSALVEASSAALSEIEEIMQEAYNNAYLMCCGRAGQECCGSPVAEWSEADQRTMDRLAHHQRALNSALATYHNQKDNNQ